jgi:hypothetical protein
MTDGEIVKVKVQSVDEESDDIFAAVLETSLSDGYRSACAMHIFAATEIESAQLSELSPRDLLTWLRKVFLHCSCRVAALRADRKYH